MPRAQFHVDRTTTYWNPHRCTINLLVHCPFPVFHSTCTIENRNRNNRGCRRHDQVESVASYRYGSHYYFGQCRDGQCKKQLIQLQCSPFNTANVLQNAHPITRTYTYGSRCLLWVRRQPHIVKFMGSTWGPPGSCRPPVGPMNLAIRESWKFKV